MSKMAGWGVCSVWQNNEWRPPRHPHALYAKLWPNQPQANKGKLSSPLSVLRCLGNSSYWYLYGAFWFTKYSVIWSTFRCIKRTSLTTPQSQTRKSSRVRTEKNETLSNDKPTLSTRRARHSKQSRRKVGEFLPEKKTNLTTASEANQLLYALCRDIYFPAPSLQPGQPKLNTMWSDAYLGHSLSWPGVGFS